MDIHRPKHPVASLRGFLLEMFTVTCGIIIALGLDGLVVAHHNDRLRQQALRDFQAEVGASQQRLGAILSGQAADSALIEKLLQYGTERLAHRPTKFPGGQIIARSFAFLPSDAWQTALATQAIAQLSFEQVRALAALHAGDVVFNDFQAHAREQWVGIAAFGDPEQLDDAEIRNALQVLRVAYAYQKSIVALAQDLLGKADAAASVLRAK